MTLHFDANTLGAAETYRLLVGSVVPRPIAWVTSGESSGLVNLAPFSSFTWVSQYPAMIGFTVSRRAGGQKDTIRNIESVGEYVVNVVDDDLLIPMHASSENLPPHISEAEHLGLELAPSLHVSVPRLRAAKVSMECVHERTVRFSPDGGDFVVGTVVGWNISPDVLVDGRIDTGQLRPVGRLAGPRYTRLGHITELPPIDG